MGHFCPPGSGSGSVFKLRIRIRIQWSDWIRIQSGSGSRSGSGSETLLLSTPIVAFPRNFFISREAATAERRYEKERQSVNYVHTAAFSARTRVFSPLIALPLPLSHPPPINPIRGAGLRLFPPPPPPSHPLRIVTSFWRFRPKSRMASI